MRYEHSYPGIQGDEFEFTSDCSYGCGAWMGSSRSGGPTASFWLMRGFNLSQITEEMSSGFGDCPCHPEMQEIYVRYPMEHRPVSVQQQQVRNRAQKKIEALLGAGI